MMTNKNNKNELRKFDINFNKWQNWDENVEVKYFRQLYFIFIYIRNFYSVSFQPRQNVWWSQQQQQQQQQTSKLRIIMFGVRENNAKMFSRSFSWCL